MRARASWMYQPLESSQGTPVGPAVRSSRRPRTPGQTLSVTGSTGAVVSHGAWALSPQGITGKSDLPLKPWTATAASPAAWAAAIAALPSDWPSTHPMTARFRWRAASTRGRIVRCCSASSARPAAQLTTRQFTGVPWRMSRAGGAVPVLKHLSGLRGETFRLLTPGDFERTARPAHGNRVQKCSHNEHSTPAEEAPAPPSTRSVGQSRQRVR